MSTLVQAHERSAPPHALCSWEERVLEAVGSVISYWGFKHNQGRIWAFLYLRDEPHTSREMQEVLGLSKGAISMLVRELEVWDVVRRVRIPGQGSDHFIANPEFMPMIGRVLGNRELVLFRKVREEFEQAEGEAKRDATVDRVTVERIRRMRSLAAMMEQAVQALVESGRLDIRRVIGLLRDGLRERREGV